MKITTDIRFTEKELTWLRRCVETYIASREELIKSAMHGADKNIQYFFERQRAEAYLVFSKLNNPEESFE